MTASTQRFSSRVENYVRYRPGYPKEIIGALTQDCGLRPESVVADIGSGTGLLTELFLQNGNRVFAVEPNPEMRVAGERLMSGSPNFTSVDGTAESTGLPDAAVDLVTAGQAFHWFNRPRFHSECLRILRPNGAIALIWNDRLTDTIPFLEAYEQFLHEFANDYAQVDHKQIDLPVLTEFFGHEPLRRVFPNFQQFDLAALRGRVLSSSYMPEAGQPRYAPMLEALQRLFDTYQHQGQVRIEYRTVLFTGRLR